MTLTERAGDCFKEDRLDRVRDKSRFCSQHLSAHVRFPQRSVHNRLTGNSVENCHHVLEFDKVNHWERHVVDCRKMIVRAMVNFTAYRIRSNRNLIARK